MKAKEVIHVMDLWAKPELIDSWDNTGFQIGNENIEVNKILIALDLDRQVLDKAIKEKYEIIITHHPIIFKPLNKIITNNYNENLVIDLIKNNIVAYNAHSNLDLADNGVSHALANKLKMFNTKSLKLIHSEDENEYGYGRIGEIKDLSKMELISLVKSELETDKIIVYGDMGKNVNKIAVCGGSGSDFIYDAHIQGAEVYITGDIKYHDAQLANELGLVLIDAGHYNTEKVILPIIKEYLINNLQYKIEIDLVCESSIPYEIL